jgi:hypothetical protein
MDRSYFHMFNYISNRILVEPMQLSALVTWLQATKLKKYFSIIDRD